MKLPDPEHFNFKECEIARDACWLITPKNMSTPWDDENARFRSCIVRQSDNMIVSVGFKKFFNLHEKPDVDVFPEGPFTAIEKMDGSLLCCTWTVGKNNQEEYIFRTRGTVDVRNLENGHEIDFLLDKYPKLKLAMRLNPLHTILCEWETPNNRIVLHRVKEPTLTLVGVICHNNFKYVRQAELDDLAIAWGLERPKQYHYKSIEECVDDVKLWEGKEGLVIYSQDGQHLRKIKSDWYLARHRLISGFKSINSVIDLFMVSPKFTEFSEFYEYVENTVNYEIAENCREWISQICTAYTEFLKKIEHVEKVVKNVKGFSRKEQALDFQQHFSDWRLPASFQLLDNGELDDKIIRKGIEAELENE